MDKLFTYWLEVIYTIAPVIVLFSIFITASILIILSYILYK